LSGSSGLRRFSPLSVVLELESFNGSVAHLVTSCDYLLGRLLRSLLNVLEELLQLRTGHLLHGQPVHLRTRLTNLIPHGISHTSETLHERGVSERINGGHLNLGQPVELANREVDRLQYCVVELDHSLHSNLYRGNDSSAEPYCN